MTWLLAVLRTKLGRVAAIAMAVLAGLGLARARWRSQGRSQALRAQHERERQAHDRINHADIGIGATDAERRKQLRKMGDEWSSR